MARTLRFTEETDIEFEPAGIADVHLHDLDFVMDVEEEDGEVVACTVDIHSLVQVMTLHSSMERLRYGWRRGGGPDDL